MRYIDMESYPRKSHFAFFNAMAYPYVGLTANVDVTKLVSFAKEKGHSTFHAVLWAAATAANAVPELRQRIVDGQIVEFDHCDTAHTVAMPDKTFVNCRTDCRMGLEAFLEDAKRRQEEAKTQHGFLLTAVDETPLIFASCMPWVAFTQVIQPTPIPADSNPRIVFGKYIRQSEQVLMPLSLQGNHALIDGWHIAEFFRIFQQLNDEL
jgi:chloramphenicol O-acetyltransferase type A